MTFLFQITKIGYVIHKTAGSDFQVLAGSASFLFASCCLGEIRNTGKMRKYVYNSHRIAQTQSDLKLNCIVFFLPRQD